MNNRIINRLNEIIATIRLDDKNKIANSFRIRSYNYAIKVIKSLNFQIKSISDLYDTGIGKSLLARIENIIKNPNAKHIKSKKNKLFEDLTSIISIGDKLASKLIKDYKVKSISDLKKKIKTGYIKANNKLLLGLKYYGKYKTNIPRKEITNLSILIKKILYNYDKDLKLFVCGSYRRKKLLCNDIDIIITHKKSINDKNLLSNIIQLLKKNNIIVDDITDKNYITAYRGFSRYKSNPVRRIDIRLFNKESLPTALTYYTGSYEFNRKMRLYAKQHGYKLNEYELYDIKNKCVVKVKNEKDLFNKLNIKWISPKLRNF